MASLLPLFLASGGGLLWAFGVLGKRLGVEGATEANRQVRAAITIFVYTLTTALTPLADVWEIGFQGWLETWREPLWTARLPLLVLCGVISGVGGLLGTLAFACSGSSSGLVSMIENGTYTMMSAIIIALYFREHPKPQAYVGFVFILAGVILAQQSGSSKEPDDTSSTSSEPSEPEKICIGKEQEAEELNVEDCLPEPLEGLGPSWRQWVLTLALAVSAGTCWGFGPLGKKIGVHGSQEGQRRAWTACTYLIYMLSTTVVPLLRVLCSDQSLLREALWDRHFRWLLLGTMGCGLVSGCGGMLSTFAFAQEGYYSGALISTVENGIYTVFGAVLITCVFRETLSLQQMLSAFCVTLAIVIFGLDFHKIFG